MALLVFTKVFKNQLKTNGFLFVVLFALLFSGVSGLINQVVWQRALKIYLGGSDALSSAVIVLVFMFGLGVGSYYMGLKANKTKNPLLTFLSIEACLFVVTLTIAFLLSLDFSASLYDLQSVASSIGMPLRLIYGVMSFLLLSIPCFLMGMTMSISSEVVQSQIEYKSKKIVGILFCLNTGGAVFGIWLGGLVLLPYFGQSVTLIVASFGNLLAAFLLLFSLKKLLPAKKLVRNVSKVLAENHVPFYKAGIRKEYQFSFILGFLALGYEMYLFRSMSLINEPLPTTFSTTLLLYLVFWSLGLLLSYFLKARVWLSLLLTAVFIVLEIEFHQMDRWKELHFILVYLEYFGLKVEFLHYLPCLFFGVTFGFLVSKGEKNWGSEVGNFYFFNTIGSCLGVLLFTLIGYELPIASSVEFIALGLICLFFVELSTTLKSTLLRGWIALTCASIFGFVVLVYSFVNLGDRSYYIPVSEGQYNGKAARVFWGKDGVIEIVDDVAVMWNGLWHASLVYGDEFTKTNDWKMAILPFLLSKIEISNSLVVGLGTGKTAYALSQLETTVVDAYEINNTLKDVFVEYPIRTYDLLNSKNVSIFWQDARSGLALNDTTYDLITQAPLYLKQAGSSSLLSVEYFELLKSRLNTGGVVSVYSNSLGNEGQAMLVRQTLSSMFKYTESFMNGYLVIASDSSFDLSEESWQSKLEENPEIRRQVNYYESKCGPISDLIDQERLIWDWNDLLITDKHPLVEYPGIANKFFNLKGSGRTSYNCK